LASGVQGYVDVVSPASETGPANAPADRLSDSADREELRRRYYGLLQENRVLLPGVQILVAFLVAVPFNGRFTELDGAGEIMWATALTIGCVAVVCLIAPIVFHRVGDRRRRSARLVWAIRTQRGGIAAFGLSLLVSFVLVLRFVSGTASAVAGAAVVVLCISVLWIAVPVRAIGETSDID
jgi:hypothetical protein